MLIFNWIIENKEWVFGGIGVAGISLLSKMFLIPKPAEEKNKNLNTNQNTNTNNITVNFSQSHQSTSENKKGRPLEEIKRLTNILFIDDDTDFKIVKILQKAGWVNTKIAKSIKSLDERRILDAHICFVDIQGVGVDMFKDEGLGLAGALKDKYPNKKIVVYSSQTTGDRFHESLRKVDHVLRKDAEPYQFENLVENFSKELF